MKLTRRGLFGLGLGAGLAAALGRNLKSSDRPTVVSSKIPNGGYARTYNLGSEILWLPAIRNTAFTTTTFSSLNVLRWEMRFSNFGGGT